MKKIKFENLGIDSIINSEKDRAYDVNNKFMQEVAYSPDSKDLHSLSEIIIKTSRTTQKSQRWN